MSAPPLIAAASRGQAAKYAERHRIRAWTWAYSRGEVRQALGRDVILLPGWQTHWLAPDIETLFQLGLRLSGTDIAKAAVRR